MKLLRLATLLALLAALLLVATPAHADTPNPNPTPTIEQANVYRNLLETGDWLMLIYANIPYATPPSDPVTSTFIWRLIGTDNVTELGSTTGYAYNARGYGYNVYSMYWNAANVTALSMVWGTSYIVRLSGNPAAFDTPPIYNFSLSASDYSSLTVTTTVQAELASRVLALATDLNSKWGLLAAYSLVTESEAGSVLSVYGEAFFRGAIFGLQALAPAAFSAIIRNLDVPDRSWGDDYSTNVTAQWGGTWVDTAQAAGKALFGTTYDLLSVIMLLVMSGGLLIGNIMLTGDHWNGLIDVAAFSVIGARLGMYDFAFLLLIAAFCWLYISAKVWFGMIK